MLYRNSLYAQQCQTVQETSLKTIINSGFWGPLLFNLKTLVPCKRVSHKHSTLELAAWEICPAASRSSTNSFARNYKFRGEENKPQPVLKQLWTASHNFLRLHVMLHVETSWMNFASSGLVHQ